MLLSTGERQSVRAVRDGDQRPRPPRDLAHRLAGRDRHRHVAHEGPHPRGARRPHPRRARRGLDRPRRRLPGRVDRARRHDARPRRLGHDRRRARRRRSAPTCARSTPTSPASTPPIRASCPTPARSPVVSFEEMLEMAASRRRRAAAALRRVRAQPRRAHPLPVELRRRARYRCGRTRRRPWNTPSSPPSRTRPGRLASRSSACPTRPASRARSRPRSPRRTSTST